MSDEKTSLTSMGDAFKQRRADRQQQKQQTTIQPNENTPSTRKSFLEIQAEQEREHNQRQQASRGAESNNRPTDGNNRTSGRGGERSQNISNTSNRNNNNRGGGTNNNNNQRNSGRGSEGGGGGDFQDRGGRNGGNNIRNSSGGNPRSARSSGSGNNNTRDSSLPVEQGRVCSLKDGFGFIHCADRPEQIFFHFSELRDGLKSTDLKLDDEVQFRVSEPQARGGAGEKKIAALHVTRIPDGLSIVWEYPDESFVYPIKGIVEKAPQSSAPTNIQSRGGGNTPSNLNNAPAEGTIRILPADYDVQKITGGVDEQRQAGIIVRFQADEYDPKSKSQSTEPIQSDISNNSFSDIYKNSSYPASGRAPSVLSKGDLVEISQIIVDRRTKEKYAKRISMIVSERQKHFHAQESKLLASATTEVGVVTSVKGEYGFLKSNQRHEEIYFHYSNLHEEEDDEIKGSLKEGQEMKFLVVTEGEEDETTATGRLRRRVSARKVQVQPAGSVTWHDSLAKGVTGVVIECPQPTDSGHPLETQGKIRLHTPIRMRKKHTLEEAMQEEENKCNGVTPTDKDDEYVLCTEVYIWSKDSPGGNFSYRGGTSVGVYIQNGDTLLFDVIRDYIGDGGTCRAAPTKYLVPRQEAQEETRLEPDETNIDNSKAIRLINLSLVGRAEGFVSALKDNTYGFLQFAERTVDVHFKMYQILPDALQADLRRNMGLPELVKLDIGTEVQFDISVHGTITGHTSKQGTGPFKSNNRRAQNQQQERENLKAQRILFLPPGTVAQTFPIAKGVSGRVSKQDVMQPYVGTIELDTPLKAVSLEERHPLVSKMIKTFLDSPHDTKIIYHDIQSSKEEEVIKKVIEGLGRKLLKFSHVPVTGERSYPGLACIEKISDITDVPETEANDRESDQDNVISDVTTGSQENLSSSDGTGIEGSGNNQSTCRSKSKVKNSTQTESKTIKSIRFDKNSMSQGVHDLLPPLLDDLVTCDVSQIRRSGHIAVSNLVVTQRFVPEITNTGVEVLGLVKEVMPTRNVGFLTVPDKSAQISDVLSFTLSDIVMPTSNLKIQKGDTVKFVIGKDDRSEKHYALNVTFHDTKQALNSAKTVEVNPCKGIVLLKLTKNSFLKNKEIDKKKNSSAASPLVQQNTPEKRSRWDNVVKSKDEDTRIEGSELGCILLTDDTNGIFDRKDCYESATNGARASDAASSDQVYENAKVISSIKSHLHFKRSSIAVHGHDESSFPQRGDLVSFNKTRSSNGLRDVRILSRGAASLARGVLESIQKDSGVAKFVVTSESDTKTVYDINLKEIISCDVTRLKENEPAEGILYDDQIFGICRLSDLYVESTIKVSKTNTERPKLNLTVKKDRGGTIMAQSMMAKGPEAGTKGFSQGWTTRLSAFADEFTFPGSSA